MTMQMTLNFSSNSQQFKPENDINLESQLLQKQSREVIGLKSIEWAAGLFEGEGCISHDTRYPDVRIVAINMTDKDVMESFVDLVGYGNLRGPYRYKGSPSYYKERWEWKVSKKTEVLRILKMFLPYFGKRRTEKAIEAINHLNETTY